MAMWMQGGSISTLSQQDGDKGPKRLLHNGVSCLGHLLFLIIREVGVNSTTAFL